MPRTTESTSPSSHPTELFEALRESAWVGRPAATDALRKFNHVLDEAISEAVHPLRAKIADAAIYLASSPAAAQYELHRNLIRSADRALTRSGHDKKRTHAFGLSAATLGNCTIAGNRRCST